MREFFFTLGNSIGGYLATLLIGLMGGALTAIQALRKKSKPSTPIEELNRNDLYVYEQLSRLRTLLGPTCIRVYLSKFHNGDHYIDGSDILKKSRTHEVVADGIAYQAGEFTPVLTSTQLDEMQLVTEAGPGYRTVEELPDGMFKWLCLRGGVVAVSRAAIKKNGEIIGFIGADFNTTTPPDAKQLDALCDVAGRFSVMFPHTIHRSISSAASMRARSGSDR